MPRNALVYVENRLDLSEWMIGVGKLFDLVYDDTELQQVLVPRIDHIDSQTMERWQRSSTQRIFFRYDDHFIGTTRAKISAFCRGKLAHPRAPVDHFYRPN